MGIRISKEQARKLGIDAPAASPRHAGKGGRQKLPYPMFEAQCAAWGLPKPIREVSVCLNRGWKFDFAWLEDLEATGTVEQPIIKGFRTKVALEIQGGIYGRGKPCPTCRRKPVGAHSSIRYMKEQIDKYSEAAILGWRVIQCLPEDVESGAVFPLLRRALGLEAR